MRLLSQQYSKKHDDGWSKIFLLQPPHKQGFGREKSHITRQKIDSARNTLNNASGGSQLKLNKTETVTTNSALFPCTY